MNIRDNTARFEVVPGLPEHVEGVVEMEFKAYDFGAGAADDPYPPDVIHAQYLDNLRVFPEGQLVAIDRQTGRVVGRTASMRCDFDPEHDRLHTWEEATGDGWLTTHVPLGAWMYGVDTAVHPEFQGMGIGTLLMDARFDVLRRLNLRGMIAGGMIMGYAELAAQMSAEQYVAEFVAGKRFDNNLSKQIKKGFRVLGVIANYTYDPRALNYAAGILWENPAYDPAVGPLPTHILHR
ncbi:MAG: GNAT family N-acetyltransferase [Anaerolineae bacterium]